MFGNRKDTYTETGFAPSGDVSSCKIKSQRSSGANPDRPCTWTPRLSCDLRLNDEPISHTFSAGPSVQHGKLQWVGNEMLMVNVKRGEITSAENREVAVVKFSGTWSTSTGRGNSMSIVYYDREWGVLLKAAGAHDSNKWGDAVTLVEVKP
jgi:hypothetical protein